MWKLYFSFYMWWNSQYLFAACDSGRLKPHGGLFGCSIREGCGIDSAHLNPLQHPGEAASSSSPVTTIGATGNACSCICFNMKTVSICIQSRFNGTMRFEMRFIILLLNKIAHYDNVFHPGAVKLSNIQELRNKSLAANIFKYLTCPRGKGQSHTVTFTFKTD